MKKVVAISFFLICNFQIVYSQTDTTFISLRGFEDSLGHTHLFYSTKYSSINDVVDSTLYFYNFFDVDNNQKSFFDNGFSIKYYPELFNQVSKINDIEFFNNDPDRYIFIRNSVGIDLDGRISRYDKDYVLGILGHFDDLYISPNNQNHIYAIAGNWIMQSFDGGISWPADSSFYITDSNVKYLTFSPFDESIIYGISQNQLVKSIDKGNTFTQVTTIPDWQGKIELLFDKDKKHIYATINNYQFNNYSSNIYGLLYRSDNKGNSKSWKLIKREYNRISLCIDDSISGNLFLSVGNDIYESNDYGNNFTKFAELDHHANDLYKKPKKELYATTSNKLIKIIQDTIVTILSKPIKKSLEYYPIAVGNKWFYNHSGVSYDTEPHPFNYNYTEEITKDTIDENGMHYFYFRADSLGKKYWFRIDSQTGKVYKKYSFNSEDEYLLFDLAAYTGDEFLTENGIVYDVVESDTILWDVKRYSKIYQLESLFTYQMIFAEGIGIIKRQNEFDFGYSTISLQGCVLNGTVYGDTTVVGVGKEFNNIPTQFYLSQNYPNPFNPTTTIKYSIPSRSFIARSETTRQSNSEITSSSQQNGIPRNDEVNVTLKVYDILGRKVTTLVNKQLKPGNYKISFNASNLNSGVYFYRLKAGNFIKTKKMILLR